MAIKQVIEDRFNQLEILLKEGKYAETSLLIPNITKFTPILTEEQRDFLNSARYAVNKNIEWK